MFLNVINFNLKLFDSVLELSKTFSSFLFSRILLINLLVNLSLQLDRLYRVPQEGDSLDEFPLFVGTLSSVDLLFDILDTLWNEFLCVVCPVNLLIKEISLVDKIDLTNHSFFLGTINCLSFLFENFHFGKLATKIFGVDSSLIISI
jgi:hypothetical protein